MSKENDRKINERRFLEKARRLTAIIPPGEIEDFERPDFKIMTANGVLGVEVSELLLQPSRQGSMLPAEVASFHQEVIQIAKELYYGNPGVIPVDVLVYFSDSLGGRRNKRDFAQSLVDFVRSNQKIDTPTTTYESNLPEGIGVIRTSPSGTEWASGEFGDVLPLKKEQVASIINAKTNLVAAYRERLPNSPIWLLLYSGFSVSRGVTTPYGITGWKFQHGFDKVLLFVELDNQVYEFTQE